jgi:hypothetical protein
MNRGRGVLKVLLAYKLENMKIEPKRKGKTTGIVLAAIMLASIFVTMMGTTGARSTGGPYNIIDKQVAIQKVLRGQDLQFDTADAWTTYPVTVSRIVESNIWNMYTANANNRIFDVSWPSTGAYYVNYVNSTTFDAQLSIEDASLPLTLKVGTKTVSSIAVGSLLRIDTGGLNLFNEDRVDLKVFDPQGCQIKVDINGQSFSNISVQTLTTTYGTTGINTNGWKLGSYSFQLKTKPEYACGLSAQSDVKGLMMMEGGIGITADKPSCVELETVRLTVTGTAGDAIEVRADPSSQYVQFRGGVDDTPPGADGMDHFDHTIDVDGERTYAVRFTNIGSYTIRVTVQGGPRDGVWDTITITVLEKAVVFDVPSTVVIGESFTLAGTANTGYSVDIAIDDYVYAQTNNLLLDENNEFKVEIDTATAGIPAFTVPGSVRLKAYIDRAAGTGAIGPAETDDGSIAILMVRGDLVVWLSRDTVALDNDFTINGNTVPNSSLNLLIIGPKGSGATLIDGSGKGIYNTTVTVAPNGTFSKKINVGANVDTGSYAIVVLTPGTDGHYNGLPPGTSVNDFMEELEKKYNLIAKTQEQLLQIIEDATVGAAGSDDLWWLCSIKVGVPYVKLDPIESVMVGEPLVVTGTSNRKDGFVILITVKGPKELTPQTVFIENGKFSATFDTTDAPVGPYVVKADDGDGHTDTTIVEIFTPMNYPPIAIIDSITPNPAKQGKDAISFIGHGNDSDGSVVAYSWTSSIDGLLNTSPSFTKPASELSVGVHTIYFTVQDDEGAWSSAVTGNLTILTNHPPVTSFSYLPMNPTTNETITFNALASYDPDGSIISYNWSFGDGNMANTTEAIITHSYALVGGYIVNLTVTDNEGATNRTSKTIKVFSNISYFDTEPGTYPSISGTHNGTITMTHTVNVSRIYIYPCTGTGGHIKYARIWNASWDGAEARWDGYVDDWHNLLFDKNFTLVAGETYNYTIRTGSYPQIHHTPDLLTAKGWITCTSFVDVNGKRHEGGIPAIRLF